MPESWNSVSLINENSFTRKSGRSKIFLLVNQYKNMGVFFSLS